MKNIIVLVVLCLVIPLISLNVQAIGLNYNTNSIVATSGETFCMDNYKIYNTEEYERSAYLVVDEDLLNLFDNHSRVITIPAMSKEVLDRYFNDSQGMRDYLRNNNLLYTYELCFKAPKVKEVDGQCQEQEYSGNVILVPTVKENKNGSTLSSSVSAHLDIKVICKEKEKSSLLLILIGSGIAVIVIGFMFFIAIRKKNEI